ncbi:lipopolysaccharide export system protein LptA [Shewanella sp. NFH-SH190041]|uniref:lipopolysaccharide transport periplasmic protein LptA n=1 Tax=Shewanella sp. NFH-SH190041 TaxID=2950245 RepID=UPI0021C3BFC3|nr:lipopolysaccharide transport periplasmic protein LptA [Shewanella sp. NFH-SH190041]BDM63163.1 lipopolysaccharide export system protein LptA [Shewanella sp. NFH-SH190041]
MNPIKPIIAALLCTLSFGALAAMDDLTQDVHIDAASQFADIKNKLVVYHGPVVVTQGSIKIKASELSADQKKGITILIARGKPATYSQRMDNGKLATASAKEIQYNINKRTLTLIGDAAIEQDGSQVTAERIVYDIQKQQMKAEGSKNPADRVITIIKPENFQDDGKKAPSQTPTQHLQQEQQN